MVLVCPNERAGSSIQYLPKGNGRVSGIVPFGQYQQSASNSNERVLLQFLGPLISTRLQVKALDGRHERARRNLQSNEHQRDSIDSTSRDDDKQCSRCHQHDVATPRSARDEAAATHAAAKTAGRRNTLCSQCSAGHETLCLTYGVQQTVSTL